MEILARSRARVGIPKSMVPRLVAGAGGSDLSQPSLTFRMSRRTKGWGYPSVGYPSLPYHLPPGTFESEEAARAPAITREQWAYRGVVQDQTPAKVCFSYPSYNYRPGNYIQPKLQQIHATAHSSGSWRLEFEKVTRASGQELDHILTKFVTRG